MSNVAIQAEDLGKRYRLGQFVSYRTLRESLTNVFVAPFRRHREESESGARGYIWALKNVSFQVPEGEVLGIIGRNGAGKTTLLKILTRVTTPTEGLARIRGRVGALLEVGTGFHPELTGRENVYLNGAILGMKKNEIKRKFDEIVAFSGVEQFIDTPLKRYSSGMQVRLAFAVAAHLEPDVLLIDEVLAVGDYEFQQKCLGKMKEAGKQGRTVLVVSHQLNNIASLCSRTILLDKGKIVMDGETSRVLEHYVSSSRQKAGEMVWEDPRTAPGNEKVRLHAVRIVNADGKVTGDLDINQEFALKVSYWNMAEGKTPIVTAYVNGSIGETVFVSSTGISEHVLSDIGTGSPLPAGLFESECRFPAGLFNTMTYSISLLLHFKVIQSPADITENDILSFTVHNLSGQGDWINLPGYVRPKLKWSTKYLGGFKER
jgi:lipopolysaccharide transport system ATP-binding protein